MDLNLRPQMIGIAGPSGSGKTALAQCLARRLGESTPVLSLDVYYRDLSGLSPAERARFNFDAPSAIDKNLLVNQLSALASGQSIERPVYSFATHTRAHASSQVDPGPYVIVEGLFAFYWPEVRDLFQTKVFLDLNTRVCLSRREARDRHERGRTPDSVQTQFFTTVLPMYRQYVEPTQQQADLVLDGAAPLEQLADQVIAYLTLRKGHSTP